MRRDVKPAVITQATNGMDMTGITTFDIDLDPDGKELDDSNNGRKGFIWVIINGKEIYGGPTGATTPAELKAFVQSLVVDWRQRTNFDAFLLSLVI